MDGLVVVFNLIAGGLSMLGGSTRGEMLPIIVPLVAIQAGSLWWRRRFPVAVLAIIVATAIIWWIAIPDREPGGPALAFAVYAISVYGAGRVRVWVAGIAIAIVVAAIALLAVERDFTIARNLMPAGATSLAAWVIGDYIRSRRQFFLEMVARHKQEREQAAEAERLRIARELHDVVAHNVSVIAIQAGAARISGNSTKESLESIERSARDTLSELNKLLGVLRKSPGGPELAPQPSLSDVDALLKPARDAGLDATLRIKGDKRSLPAAVELSAYRIVQEAITNVLKHANASRVEVVLDYQPDTIGVTISDNGSGLQDMPNASTGHGLIGMRERVQVHGGEMGTGSSSLGGFTVHAKLPLKS